MSGLSLAKYGVPALSKETIKNLTKSGRYLPRVQLFQGSSTLAKRGEIGPGHWGILTGGDTVQDLGESIDILVLDYHAKALDTSTDPPVDNYNPDSEEFQRIRHIADTVNDSGCMHGLEFLVFERSTKQFLTYFAYSGSAKRIAEKLIPEGEAVAATISVEFVEKGRNSWHAPVLSNCSAQFDLPDEMEIEAAIKLFRNPKAQGEEASESEVAAVKGRRR